MTKEYFTALADYSNWADNISIEWLNQINDEQWERSIESSFSSIKETTIHMVSAKKIWIDFWTKAPNPVYLSSKFKGTKDELIEIWQKASVDLKNFIENFPEKDYEEPITFIYPNGKAGQMIFWQTFPHYVNHASYHRGQLITLLRQAGFSNFSNTDFARYFLLQK